MFDIKSKCSKWGDNNFKSSRARGSNVLFNRRDSNVQKIDDLFGRNKKDVRHLK